jgi:hypothetical protein
VRQIVNALLEGLSVIVETGRGIGIYIALEIDGGSPQRQVLKQRVVW